MTRRPRADHMCPHPLVVGSTWRCACQSYWMQPLVPPYWWDTARQPGRHLSLVTS